MLAQTLSVFGREEGVAPVVLGVGEVILGGVVASGDVNKRTQFRGPGGKSKVCSRLILERESWCALNINVNYI